MELKDAQIKGGQNSRKNLSPEKRHELAMKAARASARSRKANKKAQKKTV